jgi:hypothetical protein
MNRKELQLWLEQFPEETIIEVMVQETASGYESYGPCFATEFSSVEFEHYEYESYTGKGFLTLGSKP